MSLSIARADLHLHTDFSHPGCPTIQDWVEFIDSHRSYRDWIGLVCVTEHVTPHGDRGAAKTFEAAIQQSINFRDAMRRIGVEAILGVEIETRHEDVNFYFGKEPTGHVDWLLSVPETVKAAREAGATIAQANHPLNSQGPGSPNFELNGLKFPMLTYLQQYGFGDFDSVEILNGMSHGNKLHQANILRPFRSKLLLELVTKWNRSEKHQVAMTGNSDAHALGNFGRAVTEFPIQDGDTLASQYFKSIQTQQTCPRAGGYRTLDLRHSALAFLRRALRRTRSSITEL